MKSEYNFLQGRMQQVPHGKRVKCFYLFIWMVERVPLGEIVNGLVKHEIQIIELVK